MIYYDENQLPEMLDRLCEHFPLQHRAVIMEAKRSPKVSVYTCEDGDVHVRVDPHGMNVTGYTMAGVFGYIIALATDRCSEYPDSLAIYDIDQAAAKVMLHLKVVNPDFVQDFVPHLPDMVTKWYEGRVHEALVTQPPADFVPTEALPQKVDVFDDSPVPRDVMELLHQRGVLNAAFGATLIPPPLHPVEDPLN